ncbi:MAG: T9SS type A sorting domain-containing protein [Chitinophagaceae bacterium]|jgi:hypothetical protein
MRYLLFAIQFFCTFNLFAQNNTVSGGGEFAGSTGSVTFSVGQIAYTSVTGANATMIQGLQQPFELLIITNLREPSTTFNAHIYPNPAQNQIIISVVSERYKNLRYVLMDLNGRIIGADKIIQQTSFLDISQLNTGTYFLRLISNEIQVQIFKIIKNK